MEREGNILLENELDKLIKKEYDILEVGCGSCSFLQKIVKKYNILGIGVDLYAPEIEDNNIKCISLEGEKIDLLDKKFDIIFLIRSFHHLNSPELFFKAVSKSLKDKGYLIIVDWKKGTDTGIKERYYSLKEMKDYFNKFGFNIYNSIEKNYTFLIVGEYKKN